MLTVLQTALEVGLIYGLVALALGFDCAGRHSCQ